MRAVIRLAAVLIMLSNVQAVHAFEKLGKASSEVAPYTLAAPSPGTIYVFSNGEKEASVAFYSVDDAKITFDYTYPSRKVCRNTFYQPIGMFYQNNCGREEPWEYILDDREIPTVIDSSFGKFKFRFRGQRKGGGYNTRKYNIKYKGTERIRVPAGEFDVHRLDLQYQRLRMQFYYSPLVPGRPIARMRDGTIVLEELVEIKKAD